MVTPSTSNERLAAAKAVHAEQIAADYYARERIERLRDK